MGDERSPAQDEQRPLLSVIIPAYNELATIGEILRRVREAPFDKEILVVDDGSTDGTAEEAERHQDQSTRLLRHERNMGKGAAVRAGIAAARGRIILIQDADLEYNPKEYERLLQPILDGQADVVYGSRFLGGPHRVCYFWHYVANKLLTLLSNALSNVNLTDLETGYKVFRREVLEDLPLREDRFGIEVELTQKIARRHWRIYEVPIAYYGRTYDEGKKIHFKDGLWALRCILRYGLSD